MATFETLIELLTLAGVVRLVYVSLPKPWRPAQTTPPIKGPIGQPELQAAPIAHGVHVECDTCHKVVARYNKSADGSVKCANCIAGNK